LTEQQYHRRYHGQGHDKHVLCITSLLCKIDGDLVLVDYKTTYSVQEQLCGVQLEAYAYALSAHGVSVDRKEILQLKKTGKYKEYPYPVKDTRSLSVFRACKEIHDFLGE